MRNRRACIAGLSFASILSIGAAASADESWTLEPSGEWSATQVAPVSSPSGAPPPSSTAAKPPEDDVPLAPRTPVERERRSPGAMAGGIVLVSVSGLAAIYGGFVAIGFKGYEAGGYTNEERVAGYTALGLGLAGTAGGIAMIAWGAQPKARSTKVWVGAERVGMSGTF